jgi:hypothetical protein
VKSVFLIFASALLFASCGDGADSTLADAAGEQSAGYQVLGQDLQALKDEFNANEGRVRLMFLSGPTCGICLRGMADLNDAFLAESQNDDRLVTFVVHVPTLGAREEHVAETIPLLHGPRIHHYWEDSGILGQHYSEVMDVFMYVWDFWAIYGPDARWEGKLPPKPLYFEHQLGFSSGTSRGFPRELILNAERFATKALETVETVDSTRFAKQAAPLQEETDRLADGTEINVIAQPRDVAVGQHIRGRGGYTNLIRVRSISATGTLEAKGREYGLKISTRRPNEIRRELKLANQTSVAENAQAKVVVDTAMDRGLSTATETMLLDLFEFDGLFVEWGDKGHEVAMVGMLKIGDVLAWKLELKQKNGPEWNMFVDSHSGDLVKMEMLSKGHVQLAIRQSEFRDVSGIRFPHKIEYFGGDGNVIAREIFDSIAIELDEQTISH